MRIDHDSHGELREIIKETVDETFIQLGINHDDPIEFQKDMAAVRSWRKAQEQMRNRAFLTVVGIVVTGIAAAVWVGVQEMISHAK